MKFFPAVVFLLAAAAPFARGQSNYEIQVYGSETVAPRTTMVELHSNFTADGQRNVVDGMEPTNHAEHETIEITQGVTSGLRLAFTSSPARAAARAFNGSATTSGLASAHPKVGIGR